MATQKTKLAVNPATGKLDLINDVATLVDGPASSTDNALARFDGTTGKLLQNSTIIADDSGVVTGISDLQVSNTNITGNTVRSTSVNANLNLQTTGTGKIVVNNALSLPEISTPATPPSGSVYIYAKLDNNIYQIDDLGVETRLTNAAAGDVTGPASSTDNALARFDSTTGKIIQNSVAILADTGELSGLTQVDVDNLRLDANTLSSTNTNGNILLDPNGTGFVGSESQIRIPLLSTPAAPAGGYGNLYFNASGFPMAQSSAQEFLVASTYPVRSVTSTSTVNTNDTVLRLSGASFVLTLPAISDNDGKMIKIRHNGTSLTQLYTISPDGADTVDNLGSYVLYNAGEVLELVANNATGNWDVMAHRASTSPASYTPITAGLGTTTSEDIRWWRQGSDLLLQGILQTGTTTATEAQLGLPTGLTVGGFADIQLCGIGTQNDITAFGQINVLMTSGDAFVNFAGGDPGIISRLSPGNGDAIFISNQAFSFNARIPITQWQP